MLPSCPAKLANLIKYPAFNCFVKSKHIGKQLLMCGMFHVSKSFIINNTLLVTWGVCVQVVDIPSGYLMLQPDGNKIVRSGVLPQLRSSSVTDYWSDTYLYIYNSNLSTKQCLMVLNFHLKAYFIMQGQRCDQAGENNLVLWPHTKLYSGDIGGSINCTTVFFPFVTLSSSVFWPHCAEILPCGKHHQVGRIYLSAKQT